MFEDYKTRQSKLGETKMVKKLTKEERKKLKKKLNVMMKLKRVKGLAKEVARNPDKAITKYAHKFGVSKDTIRELALDKTDKLAKNPVVARLLRIPKSERTDKKIAEARAELVKKKRWRSELAEKRAYESDRIKGKKDK